MAVTTEYSTEYTAGYQDPHIADVTTSQSGLQRQKFTFTQGSAAGDAGSLAYLGRLPAGKVTFHPALSRYRWSAGGSSLIFDIGYGAYTEPDGDAVTADADGFDGDVDVSSAGAAFMGSDIGTLGTGADTFEFNSESGVDIYVTTAGAVIPAAMTIKGNLVFSKP